MVNTIVTRRSFIQRASGLLVPASVLSMARIVVAQQTLLQGRKAVRFPSASGGISCSGPGTALANDNFNRTETPMSGSGWATGSGDNAFNLNGTAAVPSDINSDCCVYYTGPTFTNDQWSQVKATNTGTGGGSGIGVVVRHAGSARTYYRLTIDGAGNIDLGKLVAGSYTGLTTRSVTYVAGKILGLSVSGTTIKIWYDLVQQGANVTDTSISTGSPGLLYSSTLTSSSGDDWCAGSIP